MLPSPPTEPPARVPRRRVLDATKARAVPSARDFLCPDPPDPPRPLLLQLLDQPGVENFFPADVRKRAADILANTKGGTGAYSESKGVSFIRQMVADGIEKRDGHPCRIEDLWLTDGASVGCHYIMKTLIRDSNDAVLVPIPQYPLYSATPSTAEPSSRITCRRTRTGGSTLRRSSKPSTPPAPRVRARARRDQPR